MWSRKFARLVSAVVVLTFLFVPLQAAADNIDNLQGQLNGAQNQIGDLNNQVKAHAQTAATLEQQLADMNARMDAIKARIAATNQAIAAVNAQIAVVEAQMAAKKAVLAEYVRSDYYLSDSSTLEVLVGSNNLSEFLDRKQYLESSQDRISELLAEVQAIKKQLDDKKAELTKLQADEAAEQANLDAEMAAKNDLLNKTRGEQANYQQLLDNAQAAAARLSSTIAKLMANGPMRSQGFVKKGQVIGREGSTGFSTGAHVHFGTYVNRSAVNPHQFLDPGRFMWPLQSFVITQEFGPASWSNSHYSFHDGIDIAGDYGEAVQATADGNIVINSFQPDGFGHYIVIDHGGGVWSLYGHMQ